MNNSKFRTIFLYVIVIGIVLFLSYQAYQITQPVEKYEYSQVVGLFQQDKIEQFDLDLNSGKLILKLRGEEKKKIYMVPNISIFVDNIDKLVFDYNAKNPNNPIKYNYHPIKDNTLLMSLLSGVVMVALFAGFWFFVMRQSGDNKFTSFGKIGSKERNVTKSKVKFTDVAGAKEEKEELEEFVEFLRDPQKFNTLGARIPKGVLLVGPPGTGKTLLAKAVAGEAEVPFFSISGSDFVEMFVGVGASRVRDLFDKAKRNSPSIIFIDEIDAVGRHRGSGLGGGHDEREQTLNQLLVEMDGFGSNEGVIVMAATNRRDILDPAILRSGRFDRQVYVGYPDIKGREEILKIHTRNKPLAPDVNLGVIAKTTSGFTGADLENLCNEAALLAARRNRKAITQQDIDEATLKVIAGPEKRSKVITQEDKRITAYHEAGHAICGYACKTQGPVHQVSIIPRGMAAGYTVSLENDRNHLTRKDMQEDIIVLLGGRVAERLVLEDISTGASNDLQRATSAARDMVTKYGFSEKLGPVVYGSDSNEIFVGRELQHTKNYSESIAAEIDSEVKKIIDEAYVKAEEILKENDALLHKLCNYLLEYEKIDGDDFKKFMESDGELPKKESETAETSPAEETK